MPWSRLLRAMAHDPPHPPRGSGLAPRRAADGAAVTAIERRVLAYLDQHGPSHRSRVVFDLASPESNIGSGFVNGSNGAVPLIMGRWCANLIKAGLVKVEEHRGRYQCHAITTAGRSALREPR